MIALGVLFNNHNEFSKANEHYLAALKINEKIRNKMGISNALANLSRSSIKLKDLNKAEDYAIRSMAISKEIGYPENIKNSAFSLYSVYKLKGNEKLALENFEYYIKMRDSIQNESTRKASIKTQLKYEYEKQAMADSVAHAKDSEIKNAELAKQKAEISAKRNQQYALFGGLFCVCVFGVFMFNRYKVTQKQKEIIEEQKSVVEEQKKLVEEKQKEILDSIHYARRIQIAQIPNEKRMASLLSKFRK